MEQKSFADKTDNVHRVPCVESKIDHFQPCYTAQNGGNVVAPSFVGCYVEQVTIVSNSQGSIPSPKSELNIVDSCDGLQSQNDTIAQCQEKLKATLRRKFSHLCEGINKEASKTPLNKIFTELHITEGGIGEVNKEHEVRQIETASRIPVDREKSINCNHIFDPLPGRDSPIRTVVTRGVAGIGKTVSTNKFTLDWAEGRANADLPFVFPLLFRDLNPMRKNRYSLVELLGSFFPETRNTEIFTHGENKMLFILDGLDESRLSLDFNRSEIVSDATQTTAVATLIINLIRGRLLPFALVWITSRPVASNQIPLEFVDLVTDVRGFNDVQKDEFFRRQISDQSLANRVIAHVKSCRSLHIMCHIPVFCKMAASVMEKKLSTANSKETPKTLTQMYIQFLSLNAETGKKKFPTRKDSNAECMRDNLISLGKLAFRELEKGHLIFYESDLILNGIKATQASMFSGVYTQIFSEELTLCQDKMFSFVHLSVQEFLAALYVYLTFYNEDDNVLVKTSSASRLFKIRKPSELILYKAAVEKALQCENGHFDIFLRFLLGLSMESNRDLLKHLMTGGTTHQRTRTEVIKHIKEKIRESPSPDRCLNLFHCLNELNDHSLVEEIQLFLGLDSLNQTKLTSAQWATLVFVLLTSEEEISVFKLSKYARSEEGLRRLLPVIKTARVADLHACNLTGSCCKTLAKCINPSQVRELDLSNNNLTDAGIKLLSKKLMNSKLEKLRLRSCNLTHHSSEDLTAVISSASCQLKELDLSDNDFQDAGVKTLCGGLESPHCKLETLSVSLCSVTEEGCTFLASALNSSRLRELDLSYNHPGELGVQLLSALKADPQCSLQELSVEQCGESRGQPAPKKYATKLTLDPNTAHRDLSLSEGDRKATRWTRQPYPDHPERFEFWTQVLCREQLTGRCYWETEWSGRAVIGVAYKRMRRTGEGKDAWLGKNDCSWGLSCTKDAYTTWHNDASTALTVRPGSNKVGVHLDWAAGTLSFFAASCGALTLLHTFRATFTEPVCPAFRLGWVESAVHLC